jgi:hypothetical protein
MVKRDSNSPRYPRDSVKIENLAFSAHLSCIINVKIYSYYVYSINISLKTKEPLNQ